MTVKLVVWRRDDINWLIWIIILEILLVVIIALFFSFSVSTHVKKEKK